MTNTIIDEYIKYACKEDKDDQGVIKLMEYYRSKVSE